MEAGRSKGSPGESGTSGLAELRPARVHRLDDLTGGSPPERAGFSGTCKTTLTDWIQLIQMGRRDAVLSVRSDEDGGEATLWCQGGDIIDAVCDGLTGEDAVYRALSWKTGSILVDFGTFDHRCWIKTPTTGLLLEAMLRKDNAGAAEEVTNPNTAADGTTVVSAPFVDLTAGAWHRRLALPSGVVAGMVVAATVLMGVAAMKSQRKPPQPQPSAAAPGLVGAGQAVRGAARAASSVGMHAAPGVAAPAVAAPAVVVAAAATAATPAVRLLPAPRPARRRAVATRSRPPVARAAGKADVSVADERQPRVQVIVDAPQPRIQVVE